MKTVIAQNTCNTVLVSDLSDDAVIIAYKKGKPEGFIVHESNSNTGHSGWILRFPSGCASNGHHKTRAELIASNAEYGYEFKLAE